MGLKKASLLLYFLYFLHLQHHFLHVISRSTISLASVDPNHDNLHVQAVESKLDGDEFAGKSTEIAVVVKKGSFGGGGRSFGGGGRSFGGGGGRSGGGGGRSGGGERTIGGGGIRPIPIYGGGSHHGGHRSSGGRESASGWLGLSILVGLVFVF